MIDYNSNAAHVILVVEDDPWVRLIGTDLLGEAGFTVVEAESAEQALRIFEQRPERAVVFTDVEMPGSLNGLDLAWRISARAPGIGILVTSGGGPVPEALLPVRAHFIAKPYSAATLLSQIAAFTNAGRASSNGTSLPKEDSRLER